jgi:hypothetical protein
MMAAEQIEQRTGLTGVTLTSGGGQPPQITARGDDEVIARVNAWLTKHGLPDELPTLAEITADEQREAQAREAIAGLEAAIAEGAPTTVAKAGQRILRLERMMLFLAKRLIENN